MKVLIKDILSDQFQTAVHKLRWHKELKASQAWKLLPVDKKLKEALTQYDELRVALCEKYAKKGEDGKALQIPLSPDSQAMQYVFEKEVIEDFNNEIKLLTEQEVEIPDPVLKVSDLGDKVELNVEDLSQLIGVFLVGE